MFWRKLPQALGKGSELSSLVEQLGIEKRQFVRVRYPRLASVCKLPEISFHGRRIQVNDISLGGCCLHDPEEILGVSVGGEIQLTAHWVTGDEALRARIISRVDHRRHLQFIELTERRQTQLKKSMASGERALAMRRNHEAPGSHGPELAVRELWTSVLGDVLVIESGVHQLGRLRIEKEEFFFFHQAKPVNHDKQLCTKLQFEQLLLFLVNLPNPTPVLKSLIVDLETLFVGDLAGDLK